MILGGGFGAGEPPGFLVDAVTGVVGDADIRAYLQQTGQQIARKVVPNPLGPAEPPSPPNGWIDKLIAPIAEPLAEGFSSETTKRVWPMLAGGALLAFGLGYFAGGRKKRT